MDFKRILQDKRKILSGKWDRIKRKREEKNGEKWKRGKQIPKIKSCWKQEWKGMKERGQIANQGEMHSNRKKTEKQKIEKNGWRTSRILKILFVVMLCVSMMTGAFSGVEMVNSASQIRQLNAGGAFVESEEFCDLLDGYLQLLELYIKIKQVIKPDAEDFKTEPLLKGEGDYRDITWEELCEMPGEDEEYSSYARNYLNDFKEYNDRGISLLDLTEEIRSLENMVVIDKGKVYYTSKTWNAASEADRREIKQLAKNISKKNIYQGTAAVLPDFGEITETGKIKKDDGIRDEMNVSLISSEIAIQPQNVYQEWIFESYPEYAESYMKTVIAEAFRKDFQMQEDGTDYAQYRTKLKKDYKKSCYVADTTDFYVEWISDNTLEEKKVVCCVDEKTGEEYQYSMGQEFYLSNGKKITGAFLAEYDGEEQGVYHCSYKEYAEILKEDGEKKMAALSAEKKPWKMKIVPCSMGTAQAYVSFLMGFYSELQEFLDDSPIDYYYKSGTDGESEGNRWTSTITGIQDGKTDIWEEKTEESPFLYAYYDSNGSVFQTNFSQTELPDSGELQNFLKEQGEEWGKVYEGNKNYIYAVGVNIQEARLYSSRESISKLYHQYKEAQRESEDLEVVLMQTAGILFISLIVIALSYLFLLVMCGHRKNRETIELLWYDRIWLELVLPIGIGAGMLFLALTQWVFDDFDERYYHFTWITQKGVPVLLAVMALLMAWVFLSLVKRRKARQLISTSLLCWNMMPVCKRLFTKVLEGGRSIKGYFEELVAWKRYLVFLLINLADGIFLVWMLYLILYNDDDAIILFLIGLLVLIGVDGVYFIRSLKNALADEKIRQGAERIAGGELSYQIETIKGISKEQAELVDVINHIGEGLEQAVEESLCSERMKTELITNVSHDIKTPLTSVINYIDLLKREKIDNERAEEYLEVLDAKSQRLKVLIEDLVEASKASSGALELQITQLNFNELVHQTNGEFEEKFERAGLRLVADIPQETVSFQGDGRRVYRVLENLYSNVAKYAMPGTRVYIELLQKQDKAVFVIKNISKEQMNITPEELTERFVRGEKSRTTEGSGLGLSIAKDLTELMQGEFHIHLDGDLFRVMIAFPVK